VEPDAGGERTAGQLPKENWLLYRAYLLKESPVVSTETLECHSLTPGWTQPEVHQNDHKQSEYQR
jgi:hypothetical protein